MDDAAEDFLQRLGGIHRAIHTDGLRMLRSILTTCQQMLTDRGCVGVCVADDPVKEMVASRPVVRSNQTLVFLHMEDKVGVKFARSIVEQSGDHLAVCVSIDGPTAFTRNEFHSSNLQFMLCKTLCVNLTRHKLVPKHTLLTDRSGYDPKTLPLLLESDPVVQYYNWPVGSMVKIDRVFAGNEPIPYVRLISASS